MDNKKLRLEAFRFGGRWDEVAVQAESVEIGLVSTLNLTVIMTAGETNLAIMYKPYDEQRVVRELNDTKAHSKKSQKEMADMMNKVCRAGGGADKSLCVCLCLSLCVSVSLCLSLSLPATKHI